MNLLKTRQKEKGTQFFSYRKGKQNLFQRNGSRNIHQKGFIDLFEIFSVESCYVFDSRSQTDAYNFKIMDFRSREFVFQGKRILKLFAISSPERALSNKKGQNPFNQAKTLYPALKGRDKKELKKDIVQIDYCALSGLGVM